MEFGTHEYDVFISYAHDDEAFVKELAAELKSQGVRVWFDRFALDFGDSLVEKIDEGLARSQFGLIVVSKRFFEKKWPKKELNTLLSLHVSQKTQLVPVLHELTFEELQERSPLLADLLALDTARGAAPIVGAITKKILAGRNESRPVIDSYQALFTIEPTEIADHYRQSIHVNGVYRVPPGQELVYRDIVTTSSPRGKVEFFEAVPTAVDGLDEQLKRSEGRFMHFELKGPPGSTTMQVSALLVLTKKFTPDDGYIALRLPYDTKFVSIVLDYRGLDFEPTSFTPHVDAQSEGARSGPDVFRLTHWATRSVLVAHAENFSAGSNPMIGWGRWEEEWGRA